MAKNSTPDSGTWNLGSNTHGQPFFLEYYTDSTTRQRVYTLRREQANQRDDRESVHGLQLSVLKRLVEVIGSLEP